MDDTQIIMSKLGTVFLRWKRMLQRKILPFNCSLKQFYLLNQLYKRDYMIPSEIADHLYCDRPTASVVIKNMEKAGWISKVKDPGNGRSYRIFLSKKGKEKKEETSAAFKLDCDPLENLSEEEKIQLLYLLRKIEI